MNTKSFRRNHYNAALSSLENLIDATPTGPIREELTMVNIKMMELQEKQIQEDRLSDN